jgi:hypothetical protein
MLERDSDFAAGLGTLPARATPRRRRAKPTPPRCVSNSFEIQAFPAWARLAEATADRAEAAFAAGAGLALLDRILRAGDDGAEPVFAGVLRQRLALNAAASCARLARLRADEAAPRDGEHLAACSTD